MRRAAKLGLTASVARLVTRRDSAYAPEAVLRLLGPKASRRRAASVLMPLARKSTDVVMEVKRGFLRGRTSACG